VSPRLAPKTGARTWGTWHHDVVVDGQFETTAHVLHAVNEQVEHLGRRKVGLPMITTEGYKMGLSGVLQAPQAAWHGTNLHRAQNEVECYPG